MAKPPRTAVQGTFFVTAVTYNRRRLFQVERNARLLMDTLQHYRLEGLYKLFGFVVMPDHVHLLLTATDLPIAMQRIKGGFSHRLGSKFPVWQKGYADHLVQIVSSSTSAGLHPSKPRARWSRSICDGVPVLLRVPRRSTGR